MVGGEELEASTCRSLRSVPTTATTTAAAAVIAVVLSTEAGGE